MSSGEGGLYRSRLGKKMDEDALSYLSSLNEDREIFLEDVEGTEAHVIMLCEQGILANNEAKQILRALEDLKKKIISGEIELKGDFEDVHEFVESYVISRVGMEIGGKVHSGRSRNDQVALDIRLRLRRYILETWRESLKLAEALLSKAEKKKEALVLHYTHLQQAQVGYLSHYLLSHLDHLLRDLKRLEECYHRVNRSPLGACAIAGSTLPLNRDRIAELLGFEDVVENSIDAVSSRDFALEAVSAATIMMVNLSRIAEDLIIWSSSEFGYIELPDDLASPSSVMPHKKNPCILELLRAKAGKSIGLLTSLLTMTKGIPTGYDRDLQEEKPVIWEAFKETRDSIRILAKVIEKMDFKDERAYEAAAQSFAPAIELAEALIKHSKLSLREAHRLVGALVAELHKSGLMLRDSSLKLLNELAERVLGRKIDFPEDVFARIIDASEVPSFRETKGASSIGEVEKMIENRRKRIEEARDSLRNILKNLRNSKEKFENSLEKFLNPA